MVVHRSQAASSQEQSSGQWTLLRGTASRIALLLFLLGSWLLIPDIRSNNFSHVIPITQAHIHETNKHFNLQGNEYIDDGNKYNKNAIRYKVTSPVWKRNKSSHGSRIIMPPRRVMKAKTANKEPSIVEGVTSNSNHKYILNYCYSLDIITTTSTPMMIGMMMKEIIVSTLVTVFAIPLYIIVGCRRD